MTEETQKTPTDTTAETAENIPDGVVEVRSASPATSEKGGEENSNSNQKVLNRSESSGSTAEQKQSDDDGEGPPQQQQQEQQPTSDSEEVKAKKPQAQGGYSKPPRNPTPPKFQDSAAPAQTQQSFSQQQQVQAQQVQQPQQQVQNQANQHQQLQQTQHVHFSQQQQQQQPQHSQQQPQTQQMQQQQGIQQKQQPQHAQPQHSQQQGNLQQQPQHVQQPQGFQQQAQQQQGIQHQQTQAQGFQQQPQHAQPSQQQQQHVQPPPHQQQQHHVQFAQQQQLQPQHQAMQQQGQSSQQQQPQQVPMPEQAPLQQQHSGSSQQQPQYVNGQNQQQQPQHYQGQPQQQQQQGYATQPPLSQQGHAPQQYQQQQSQYSVQPSQSQSQQEHDQQTAQSLPQLAGASDHGNLRKQFETQSQQNQQQQQPQQQPQQLQQPQQQPRKVGLRPVQNSALIVGMVGTTPIVKIHGTEGHVVKKKKGRFHVLAKTTAAATAAGVEAGQPVPSVVVANREQTLSNGSVMSQMTGGATIRTQTIDGTGAPVIKQKGRFMVSNLKNPGQGAAQPAQSAPQSTPGQQAEMAQQSQHQQMGALPTIDGSPSNHQKNNSGDQSIQGIVQPSNSSQETQQHWNPGEILMHQPLQQVIIQDGSFLPQMLPQQGVHQVVYPAQIVQTTQQQVYQNPASYDVNTTPQSHQQIQPGGVVQMAPQHLLYNPQFVAASPAMTIMDTQQREVPTLHLQPQQQQPSFQQQQTSPPTPPPAQVASGGFHSQNGPLAQECPAPVPPFPPPPLTQGVLPAEEVAAGTGTTAAPKAPKQPLPAQQAPVQPPRNKQRNLVAPRNGAGYGNGGGLGKVFYFLDQMKNEVTDADRTIKSLQKDMKFMREKNKELEARNRDLEKRLREEQALRETAQTKLRVLKKKGRGEKNGAEAAEENGNLRRPKLVDSPAEGGVTPTGVKNMTNGTTPKAPNEGQTTRKQPAATTKTLAEAPKQNRGVSPQTGTTKPPRGDLQNGNSKPKGAQPPPLVFKTDAKTVEFTIAEKNLAELETKKTNSASASIPVKSANGKLLPPYARQRTDESMESKRTNTGGPRSPVRAIETGAVGVASEDPPKKLPPQNGGPANNINQNASGGAMNEPTVNANPPPSIQRSATAGSKIPSAIEFDPLKSTAPNEMGISLDANGRSSPVESVSSLNGVGFTNADVGLAGNNGFPGQHQYSQSLDIPATVVPVVGMMGYQQANGAFQQAAMMPMTQQQFAQTMDQQNRLMSSNLSVLQQPFLQVSDQQSIHSMPVSMADLSQPMILINPQHVRAASGVSGVTMHDFSSADGMITTQQHQQLSNVQEMSPSNTPHHSRANSLQINMNPSWNQNAQQWASMAAGSMGQPPASQPSTSAPADPFDELVTRRPMAAMSADGK